MTMIIIPETGERHTSLAKIEQYLADRDILYKHFTDLEDFQDASDEHLINQYRSLAEPHLNINSMDVIRVTESTPGLQKIKDTFNKEHTHSDEEIRFLLTGVGIFWIHLQDEVFGFQIVGGDLIRLPAYTKHWFIIGELPLVALRFFNSKDGWVGDFTNSGIEQTYTA